MRRLRNLSTVLGFALAIASTSLVGCTRSSGRPEPAAPGSDSAAGGEASADDPLVCEKVEVPGHRTRKRVCRHESEIRAEREATQRGIRGVRPEQPPVPGFGSGGM